MHTTFIAVDIGGTQIRAALYQNDEIIPKHLERITTQGACRAPLDRLIDVISSIWPADNHVTAIAVATAGPTDPFEGIVFESPNIPGWTNLPLKKILQDRYNVPTTIGNDANLAALGEWKYGSGRGHHNLIYITVSTGIGGGIIINDQLLLGSHGLAGELGHITLIPDGPVCSCGQLGHLEAIASGPAIARWVENEISQGKKTILSEKIPCSAHEVAEAAKKLDPLAIAAINRAGTYLGIAIADQLHIFNPSAVIIGGGVSHSGAVLLDPLKKSLHKHVFSSKYLEGLLLTTASLGDEVGLLGSLALAKSMSGS